jgi:heat shock protein HspQ
MILINSDYSGDSLSSDPPLFRPGDKVRHKRYDYRGVVVAVDLHFKADNDWYQSNMTQPDKNQPWYHVLVHKSETVTYPAQSSLEADEGVEPVRHPWISLFFNEFKDGCYTRNNRPWPGNQAA